MQQLEAKEHATCSSMAKETLVLALLCCATGMTVTEAHRCHTELDKVEA